MLGYFQNQANIFKVILGTERAAAATAARLCLGKPNEENPLTQQLGANCNTYQ